MNIRIKDLILSPIDSMENTIDLGIANPSLPCDSLITQALLVGDKGYGKSEGEEELRQAIASKHKCPKEETIICLGSTNGLSLFFQSCLNEGDEILILNPSYPVYREYCKASGVVPIHVDLNKYFQVDELSSYVSSKTRAMIINSPHNPSGCLLNEQSLELIRKSLPDNLYIVFDNVYEEMSPQKIDYTQFKQNIIRIYSFSKLHSMCEYRVGYVLANSIIIENMKKIIHLSYASIASCIQKAALIALLVDEQEKINYYMQLKKYAYQRIINMGLECQYGEGPFYLFPSIKRFHLTSSTFCRLLREHEKVVLVPGSVFMSEYYVRIACCSDMETLKEGLDRLERFIENYENL